MIAELLYGAIIAFGLYGVFVLLMRNSIHATRD